jgi:hypothetical protein
MRIFVSYTTRNNENNREQLLGFSKCLAAYGSVFIDMLDNDALDKQKRVIAELKEADILILIKTKSVMQSPWVNFELSMMKRLHKPILEIDANSIYAIAKTDLEQPIHRICNAKMDGIASTSVLMK